MRYKGAIAGFEDFWDEGRGTYADHIVDRVRKPACSQTAGAAAVVSGLVPRERWSRVVDTITDETALVVRAWISGNDREEHFRKLDRQAKGIQEVDWNVRTEIVLAEPFFSYVVHDAVALAGRAATLPRLLRSWSTGTTRSASAGDGEPTSTAGAAPPPATSSPTSSA